jgi:arginase
MSDGLMDDLARKGIATDVVTIPAPEGFEGEIGKSFEIMRRVASEVREAIAADRTPVVLAGNCNTSVGVRAGLGDEGLGVIWFDAHADFDTPDQHRSGYFDGMGVATLVGQCWNALAASIPGFRPVGADRIVYCGIRDFEPGQAERVRNEGIAAVFGSTEGETDFVGELHETLSGLRFDQAMVHIDLDCLDTKVGQANEYAAAGGLSEKQLVDCMRVVSRRSRPVAVTLASFDPRFDGADRISAAGRAAVATLLA